MKRYSQNREQDHIVDFFKGQKGTYLDLGAYDGVNLSNTRALTRLGWNGVLIEASPTIYERLVFNCKDYANVLPLNFAVSDKDDIVKFFDNLNAVGTMHEKETKRWGDTEQFKQIEIECRDIKTVLEELPYTKYDFVSIDCEGEDLNLLKRIDFMKYQTKMVCVEWNSINQHLYDEVMIGWRLIHRNAENLIYAI